MPDYFTVIIVIYLDESINVYKDTFIVILQTVRQERVSSLHLRRQGHRHRKVHTHIEPFRRESDVLRNKLSISL